jgi:hypothetical protein
MQFVISTTDGVLIPQAGLGLVGALLQDSKLRQRIDALDVEGFLRPEVKHGDVVAATIGLLCLGRSDFNDIEMFRNDQFFRQSWGLCQIPSEPTLRQRLDAMRDLCGPILREESALLLRKRARKPTPGHGEWVALDIDVSPFDNSGTKKEGVSWTYKKVDGFAPIFACLGEEGYMVHCQLREGKEVYTGETWRERNGKLYRVVFEVIQRTITADGQKLLVPDIEVNTWWTSLKLPPKVVIGLYHARGTSEQCHSEIKTDMDLERLPSGKFATNATMSSLGLVAYNVLRLCGQGALHEQRRLPAEDRAPLGKKVFRRRLRSVIQDLMYLAVKLTRHANRWRLSFWQNSPWGATWRRLYARFCGLPIVRSG